MQKRLASFHASFINEAWLSCLLFINWGKDILLFSLFFPSSNVFFKKSKKKEFRFEEGRVHILYSALLAFSVYLILVLRRVFFFLLFLSLNGAKIESRSSCKYACLRAILRPNQNGFRNDGTERNVKENKEDT